MKNYNIKFYYSKKYNKDFDLKNYRKIILKSYK